MMIASVFLIMQMLLVFFITGVVNVINGFQNIIINECMNYF